MSGRTSPADSYAGTTATSGTSTTNSSLQKQQPVSGVRKSSIGRAVDKAKAKVNRSPSGAEVLADDEQEFERLREKERQKEDRRREYERLGLGEKTKFGMNGAGGYGSM